MSSKHRLHCNTPTNVFVELVIENESLVTESHAISPFLAVAIKSQISL